MWRFLNDDPSLLRQGGIKVRHGITANDLVNNLALFLYKKQQKSGYPIEDMLTELSPDYIEFDCENFGFIKPNDNINNSVWICIDDSDTPQSIANALRPYVDTSHKTPYILFMAGGDWEEPIHGCIYYDGISIKIYIPSYGNSINLEFKSAFGNHEDGEYDSPNNYDYNKYGRYEVFHYCEKYGGTNLSNWFSIDANVDAMLVDFDSRIDLF